MGMQRRHTRIGPTDPPKEKGKKESVLSNPEPFLVRDEHVQVYIGPATDDKHNVPRRFLVVVLFFVVVPPQVPIIRQGDRGAAGWLDEEAAGILQARRGHYGGGAAHDGADE